MTTFLAHSKVCKTTNNFLFGNLELIISAEYIPDETPGSAYSEDVWIATSYVQGTGTSHIHYVSPDARRIVQYSREGGNTDWAPAETGYAQWGRPQNGIAAVSWDNQLRLVYEDGGEIVTSALSGNEWTGPKKSVPS